jgi:hypothetical protein
MSDDNIIYILYIIYKEFLKFLVITLNMHSEIYFEVKEMYNNEIL